jgi:hypothetical protein
VRKKENKPPKTTAKPGHMTLISESRLAELRTLKSTEGGCRQHTLDFNAAAANETL